MITEVEKGVGRPLHKLSADEIRAAVLSLARHALPEAQAEPAEGGSPIEALRLKARTPQRSEYSTSPLHREYDDYVDSRIEEYKDALMRAEILALGDEAVAELAKSRSDLTEAVLQEQIDSLIRRRLKLPDFRTWRNRTAHLRSQQRNPSYWKLTPGIITRAVCRTHGESVLVVQPLDTGIVLYLAALGNNVHVWHRDLTFVERLEERANEEAVGQRVEALVAAPDVLATAGDRFNLVLVHEFGRKSITDHSARHFAALTEPAGKNIYVAKRPMSPSTLKVLHRAYDGWRTVTDRPTLARVFVATAP